MAKTTPPNVVRVVMREWLATKNIIFDKILNAIADELAPIVAEQAKTMLTACLEEHSLGESMRQMLSVCCLCKSYLHNEATYADAYADACRENLLGKLNEVIVVAQMWVYGRDADSPATVAGEPDQDAAVKGGDV